MSRDDISDRLAAVGYIADHDVATALWLMDFLKRPLLLEGEAGVGKTEVAKALAAVHGAELIRLTGGEGHFVYVDPCEAPVDVNGVALCRDRPGVDRSSVHARLAVEVSEFLERHLGGADGR